MTDDNFERLRKETIEKLKVSEENLCEKSIDFMTLSIIYYNLYIKELREFKDLITEKEKLYSTLYTANKQDNNLQLKNKSEVENYIFSNKMYYDFCLRYNKQDVVVKYLEGVCDLLKRSSYTIKNIIDLKNIKGC
jgi:hypothetical protein